MKEDLSYDGQVERDKLPGHVAVIMDGNGRWAKARRWARSRGHQEGADSVRAVVRMCGRVGVRELTLYAFSTENWQRPRREVDFLMGLLKSFLEEEREAIMENDVQLRAIGRLDGLPDGPRQAVEQSAQMSRNNSGLVLRLALNYGGRQEIADAARRMAQAVAEGRLDPGRVGLETLRDYLYEPGMSDPDLLIRTGGEMRLSNFLLWQVSYAELYVTPVCWPDFRERQLAEAFAAYAARERRFGTLASKRRRKGVPAAIP